MYFYPPAGAELGEGDAVVSVLPQVLSVKGASHTSFSNLVISDAQSDAASLSGVGLRLFNSTVSNAGGGCLSLSGSNSSVRGAHFSLGTAGTFHLGTAGVISLTRVRCPTPRSSGAAPLASLSTAVRRDRGWHSISARST